MALEWIKHQISRSPGILHECQPGHHQLSLVVQRGCEAQGGDHQPGHQAASTHQQCRCFGTLGSFRWR